jgi:hypothetical protein
MPSWNDIGPSTWVTGNNLVESGIALNSGQSATANDTWMIKSILTTKYDVLAAPLAGYGANDWVIKQDVVPNVTLNSFYLRYTNGTTDACVSTTYVTVYSPCSTLTAGCNLFDNAAGTILAASGEYSDGTTLFIWFHFNLTTEPCGASYNSASILLGQFESDLCNYTYSEICYWSGVYGAGTALYLDSGFTVPVSTFYNFVQGTDNTNRYLTSGVVGSPTGNTC